MSVRSKLQKSGKSSHLKLDRIRVEALPSEHSHSMMEDITPTLDPLIHPTRTILLLIKRYRESLATTVIHRIDEGDIESVRVLRQMVRT